MSPNLTQSVDGWPPAPEPVPGPVVDNHCHLDHPTSDGRLIDVDEALDRAAAVGVTRIVQVGCDVPSSEWAVQTARSYPSVVAAVALHPNEAPLLAEKGELDQAIAEIDRLAAAPAVRAIGETGLDYFRTADSGQASQHESFRAHIQIAKRHDRALMIHDRDAHDDVLAILDDEGVPQRTILHCFSGDADFARACLERGAYLSFAGTVTFKNAENVRQALRVTPLDRILVETDAPFLAPTPHRGKPNASYLVPITVRAIAAEIGVDLLDMCEHIVANTDRAFGGPWAQRSAASFAADL